MLTGNGVSGIKFILVFNEAEAAHELDLGDFATSILGEVVLNVRLGSCGSRSASSMTELQPRTRSKPVAESLATRGRGRRPTQL